jgi:cystinosin
LLIAVTTGSFQRIDLLYYLSYIKLGITFLKYSPQVYANYRAQSTVGWSIHSILFDIAGGIFSTAQLVLDAYYAGDWSGISGDLVKLGLGLFSIFFDLIFMTQHFILYRNREDFYVPVSTAENHNGKELQNMKNLLLSSTHGISSQPYERPARDELDTATL